MLDQDMNTLVINSWNELQDALFANAWQEDIGRYRSSYAFRGLSDSQYQLDTSLMRLGGEFASLERHILRNFKKYAHRSVVERDSIWHWMTVAQHYGLPTRLLDWTYSPFVALHFATANIEKMHLDGVIWAVDYVYVQRQLPASLSQLLAQEGGNVATLDMLTKHIAGVDDLAALQQQSFPIFVEPSALDDRIVNQYAFFSMMSQADVAFDRWLLQHMDCWRRLVIPASLKWEIRDKLDQANITERVLFPGLDGLSRWLKRHYSPRN